MTANEQDWLAERFEANRPQLRAVAYRMLGSLSEADDAVQEAWLRLSRSDASRIENLSAWLMTVVGRVSLDMLRSRRSRGEEPLAGRLPDLLVDRVDGVDPEHEALLADSVGLALLVVLETLTPPERLAFVLHDIFAVSFGEIAPIVDRSPEAARQLASRARRRVRAERTVPDADLETQREAPTRFWRLTVTATSIGSWRCSIRTSCSGPISGRQAARRSCVAPTRWRARRSPTLSSGWTSGPR
jgi:RNA polymerase sigma factor (sigma-70 family)